MPELCRFYGIIIRMYAGDHVPPHFHAVYGEYEALVGIESLSVVRGRLPPRAHGMVIEWASLHQQELWECWDKSQLMEPPDKIAPLP